MVKKWFFNRHAELRYGWRMLLFVMITSLTVLASASVLQDRMGEWEFLFEVLTLTGVSIATFVLTRFVNKKPFGAIGLLIHPAMVREFGLGCLLGMLMVAGIFLVEFGLGYAQLSGKGLSLWQAATTVGKAAATFAVVASAEELFFRGYLFQTLIQAVTFLPALLLAALFFSLSHGGNPGMSALSMINIALAGGWLSFAYMKTRSLWLPIGLHFSWNFTQTNVFSFPTSGLPFDEKRLFLLTQSGPDWLTGGSFGPEGGILATIAILFCTVHILKSSLYTVPEGIITLDSMEDLLPPADGSKGLPL